MRFLMLSATALVALSGCVVEARMGAGTAQPVNNGPAVAQAQPGRAPAPQPAPLPRVGAAPAPAPVPNTTHTTVPLPGQGTNTTNPLNGVIVAPANPPPAQARFVDPGMRPNLGAGAPFVLADTDFGTRKADTDSLVGSVYFLPTTPQALPDFSTMTPAYRLYARTFAVGPRPFVGFANPNAAPRNQNFGLRYDGTFSVNAAGAYTLYVASEHGSRVYIDGQVALNNDGVHPVTYQQGDFNWTAGTHTIRVDYFVGNSTEVALELWVSPVSARQSARVWTPEI